VLIIISIAVGYALTTNSGFASRANAFVAPVNGLSMPGVSSGVANSDPTVLRPAAMNQTLRASQPTPVQQSEMGGTSLVSLEPTVTPEPAEEADAVTRAAAAVPTVPPALFFEYEVREGDTVSSIATAHGIQTRYILANNHEIVDGDFLRLGQRVQIPAADGILHWVRYGETLTDIADRYQVTVGAITGFALNNIATPDDISESQLLLVPGATPFAPTPVAEPAPVPTDAPDQPAPIATPAPTEPPPPPPAPGGGQVSGEGLIWPIYGPISSYMGPSHPLGIDIDGFNLVGQPIVAATSGTVVFAGGNACCSYGLYVVIVSPGGIETLYAHLSSISVVQGQQVSQGQVIGIIGNTGYSTGTHLHFEVIDNGVRVNPLAYLP
jgi:murein DD-endopeptidase MepM/ murein hydrolase activator NlpD